jgi:hypothetical protein
MGFIYLYKTGYVYGGNMYHAFLASLSDTVSIEEAAGEREDDTEMEGDAERDEEGHCVGHGGAALEGSWSMCGPEKDIIVKFIIVPPV